MITDSVSVSYAYNGSSHTVMVNGVYNIGERLTKPEYVGPVPPGQAGVWLFTPLSINYSPYYEIADLVTNCEPQVSPEPVDEP